jgi:hypothetical protein
VCRALCAGTSAPHTLGRLQEVTGVGECVPHTVWYERLHVVCGQPSLLMTKRLWAPIGPGSKAVLCFGLTALLLSMRCTVRLSCWLMLRAHADKLFNVLRCAVACSQKAVSQAL